MICASRRICLKLANRAYNPNFQRPELSLFTMLAMTNNKGLEPITNDNGGPEYIVDDIVDAALDDDGRLHQ